MRRVLRRRGDVVLRADFKDLGGNDHVGCAFCRLVEKRRLLKSGQGFYIRAAKAPERHTARAGS